MLEQTAERGKRSRMGIKSFGLVNAVWVTSMGSSLPLAAALQGNYVVFARKATEGMHAKMESLYAYLFGDESACVESLAYG